jgi:hypothetical protein
MERFLVGAALAAVAMVSGPVAYAADAPAGSTGSTGSANGTDSGPKSEMKRVDIPAADAKKDDKPEDPIFNAFGDFVMGSARTNVVTGVVPPSTTAGIYGTTTTGTARVTDYSLIVGGGLWVTPCFGLGMRIPIEGGTLFANPTRQDGGVGNFELSASGIVKLSDLLNLELALGITLPTAGGTQIPPSAAQVPVVQGAIDQSGYDRYSVQRAISMSRGYEDDELFQVNHFGINPKIGLRIGTAGKWNVTPWIKLDDLIATNKSYSYIGEFLYGLNLGGYILPQVEPVLRIWANAPLTGADWSGVVAVLEPQIRFHIGDSVTPYVGGVLPIAGPIANPFAYGVRVGIAARF